MNTEKKDIIPRTEEAQTSLRKFSIGEYTEYLLHCLKVEEWREKHPYTKHYKSRFHRYSEQDRRKSLPPSFFANFKSPKN